VAAALLGGGVGQEALSQESPAGKIKVTRKLNGAVPFATYKAALDALLASPPPAN
jgi:hypothetical protein